MLVIDLMHEFELGVWKALFIHLLRILNAVDKTLINELDRRYVAFPITAMCSVDGLTSRRHDVRFRQVPTFGRDTIRRFSSNISELKKLAARDYEDILQVGTITVITRDYAGVLIDWPIVSAPYRSSMVFSLSPTTKRS
jgi:hypothetical protein